MPILRSEDAPGFDLDGIAIRGFASPSRGASETMTWKIDLAPGQRLPEHTHDREEVFHVLDGRIGVSLDGSVAEVGPGDTVMIPAGVAQFAFADEPAASGSLLTVMPVGTMMIRPDGEQVAPPWTA